MITTLVILMLATALLCFVVSEISGNYSQVDKLWSLMPPIYAWVVVALAGAEPRSLLMAVLATLWGARLTANFARQGGYALKPWDGHEDYRWTHVRQFPLLQGSGRFMLFNLLFISLYQHALLLLTALPIVPVAQASLPLGWADALLAVVFVGLVAMETVADNQQWRFQSEKHRRQAAGEDLGEYAHGFVRSGLWARSRHPNYFAEQSIWVVFFGFSVVAAGFNWTVIGCVLLILLFQGSSRLSEGISAKKYPAYVRYQATVPRFLPRILPVDVAGSVDRA